MIFPLAFCLKVFVLKIIEIWTRVEQREKFLTSSGSLYWFLGDSPTIWTYVYLTYESCYSFKMQPRTNCRPKKLGGHLTCETNSNKTKNRKSIRKTWRKKKCFRKNDLPLLSVMNRVFKECMNPKDDRNNDKAWVMKRKKIRKYSRMIRSYIVSRSLNFRRSRLLWCNRNFYSLNFKIN